MVEARLQRRGGERGAPRAGRRPAPLRRDKDGLGPPGGLGGRVRERPCAGRRARRRCPRRGRPGAGDEGASARGRATERERRRKPGSLGRTRGGVRISSGASAGSASRREGCPGSEKPARTTAPVCRASAKRSISRRDGAAKADFASSGAPSRLAFFAVSRPNPVFLPGGRRRERGHTRRARRGAAFRTRPRGAPDHRTASRVGRSPGSQVVGSASVFPALRPVTSG